MAIRIMICGRRCRGKDSLADCIQRLQPKVQRAAFADAVREEAVDLLNRWKFPGPARIYDDCEEDRAAIREDIQRNKALYGPLLQFIGEYVRKKEGLGYWIEELAYLHHYTSDLVITDCRYPNEVDYGHKHGFTVVRVSGPCRGDDGRSDNHPSENQVDGLEADLEFANVGTIVDMEQWVVETLLPYEEHKT